MKHDHDEATLRYTAKQRGLPVYLSLRQCPKHGKGVLRNLASECVDCLREGLPTNSRP
jgi:hypothetical protein